MTGGLLWTSGYRARRPCGGPAAKETPSASASAPASSEPSSESAEFDEGDTYSDSPVVWTD
ncbi:hypothetical protein [Streptomyces griseus]|uniref:hypothetical protein n=1 Tax=Streptomyces griseus TaxID=1911 RepID=UPI0033E43902